MNDELVFTLKESFPEYRVNEGSQLEQIDLKERLQFPVEEPPVFTAQLKTGKALPNGIVCSEEGILSGTPEKGAARKTPYEIKITVQSESVVPFEFNIKVQILEAKAVDAEEEQPTILRQVKEYFVDEKLEGEDVLDSLEESGDEIPEDDDALEIAEGSEKEIAGEEESEEEVKERLMRAKLDELSNFWKSYADELELPDLEDILTRTVTPRDIYHLLGRFATVVIWNADDLTPARTGKLIKLKDASQRFLVFDFNVALVATPKDLFDPVRTLGDGVQTIKAMVQEVKRRKWNIELAGFDKLVTAIWVEVQQQNKISKDHKIEVYNYEPSQPDLDVLSIQLGLQSSSVA